MARHATTTFVVTGVCCATEEAVLRKRLDAGIGRTRYSYNPVTCELRVPHGVPPAEVVAGVREAGFGIRERRAHYEARPQLIDQILEAGRAKVAPISEETVRMARAAMGLRRKA